MARYIAEAGPCNNSIEYAHRAVAAAADAGAWAFKVQMYQADRLAGRGAPRYDSLPGAAADQHALFAGALPYAAWGEVQAHCAELDMVFFASVFDEEAVAWCEDHFVPLYKVASGDITHEPLLRAVADTGKPVLYSTGASTLPEILRAAEWLDGNGIPMACTLAYPCPPQDAAVARVTSLLAHFDTVGYSDHTKGLAAPCAAVKLGASYIECHFTIAPGTGGDHDFAKTPEDLALLTGVGMEVHVEHAIVYGDGVLGPLPSEQAARVGARRSIVARRALPPGHTVTYADLDFLRPGGAVPPYRWEQVVGTRLLSPMAPGQVF